MNRFLVPALVAAAVHGVVLGWPRADSTRMPPEDPPPVLPLGDFILVRDDPPVEVDATVGDAGGGSVNERPRGIEPPVADNGKGMVIEVPREPVAPIKRGITVIDGAGFGPMGEGIGDFGGPVVVKSAVLDRAPRTRLQVPPDYPNRAKEAGLDGEVVVEFVVNEAGRVMSPVIAASTDSIFDEAAIRAVLRWRFEPGTMKGRPVRFRMAVPIVFHLDR